MKEMEMDEIRKPLLEKIEKLEKRVKNVETVVVRESIQHDELISKQRVRINQLLLILAVYFTIRYVITLILGINNILTALGINNILTAFNSMVMLQVGILILESVIYLSLMMGFYHLYKQGV